MDPNAVHTSRPTISLDPSVNAPAPTSTGNGETLPAATPAPVTPSPTNPAPTSPAIVVPMTPLPTEKPAETPMIEIDMVGNDGNPSNLYPLGMCMGKLN